ncbi:MULTISPECIES: hypothetical protein [unclassified Tolypothrix]|uniref:hypothetical protein n=1 Tax=unclassified Tolypothrix TaxID=2649714 RepID=UPI0005EAABC8|nr:MULTISPECIES: hypothetical protein [unclassified Tolypothrix]EKF04196.1 hypothetical protein FDUTEX481_01873 [Tolypothrix sp. PCC 7601]BAY91279.1 hypothetical protein NIES3275_33020 [Microchaete diplosiphon NIES-3275]
MAEIKLGLGNPPQPIYMYVKKLEVDGRIYAWYNCEIEQDKKIPVSQRALTGYVLELRLTDKDFKGKDNLKLDIVVQADEIYIVRSGIETNFAKSFLLAASVVKDFTQPLIIVATPGDENSVFCNLYDAITKTRIRREWNPNADWATIIRDVQSQLTPTSDSVDYVQPVPPQSNPKQTTVTSAIHPQDLRVKQIRKLLNYPLDLIKEWLHFQDVSSPSQLHHSKVDQARTLRGKRPEEAKTEFEYSKQFTLGGKPSGSIDLTQALWRDYKVAGMKERHTGGAVALFFWIFDLTTTFVGRNPFAFTNPSTILACLVYNLGSMMAGEIGYTIWKLTK